MLLVVDESADEVDAPEPLGGGVALGSAGGVDELPDDGGVDELAGGGGGVEESGPPTVTTAIAPPERVPAVPATSAGE